MSRLERFISTLSPSWGRSRSEARLALQKSEFAADQLRRYEGAARGRRTDSWLTPQASMNTETRAALTTLRNRSRDLSQNNPYAVAAVRTLVNDIVAYGIDARIDSVSKRATQRARGLWQDYAVQSTQIDATGTQNLYGIEALITRTIVEAGECLIRRRRRTAADRLAVPMQLEVLEPDYLDTTRDGLVQENGNVIMQGKEYNRRGQCVAYWLYTEHPGDVGWVGLTKLQSIRVPAEDVIHVYEVLRPGQGRGVPWGAPCIIRLKDLSDYEDAQLMRQKVAACFAVFVHDSEQPTGAGVAPTSEEQLERVEPAMIEYLPPGKEISFATPPGVQGYAEYMTVGLRAVSAGYGVPYEFLAGDLSKVNFSSGRMGWINYSRTIDAARSRMLVPMCMSRIGQWFADAAGLVGIMEPLRFTWSEPHREMINPAEDMKVFREEIRAGKPPSVAWADRGYDFDELLEQYAADNARLDELGIILDTDPRKVAATGNMQPTQAEQKQEKKAEEGGTDEPAT